LCLTSPWSCVLFKLESSPGWNEQEMKWEK
jgi:hypothetical protein